MCLCFSRRMAVAVVLCAALTAISASADTIATFADPAADGTTPLFEMAGSTLSGGWSDVGLDLITPISADVYPDATFTMTDLTIGSGGELSGGAIEFFESAAAGGDLILRIEFDSATLFDPFGFGASELVAQGVVFSGPIITYPLEEQMFAFSFANAVTTPAETTWTASFTSSAVPEPATIVVLLVGSLIVVPRRGD